MTAFADPPLPPRPDRRAFLGAAAAAGAVGAASPAMPAAMAAETFGVRPDGSDQTRALQIAVDAATAAGRPLAVGPGEFRVTNLTLPRGASLVGTRAARLRGIGGGPILSIRDAGEVRLTGFGLAGPGAGIDGPPLLDAHDTPGLVLDDLAIEDAPGIAIALERCGGRVVGCSIRRAGTALLSLDATGLSVAGNAVEDCLDNGILIWRSQKGRDASQVVHNRIGGIGARSGGSGQYGNGVNVFRAGDVLVSDNVIADCAFSAVRNNSGDGVQILGNQASDCGEVAIFTEFAFEGAIVSSNRITRAAHGIVSTNLNDGGRLAIVSGNLVRDLFRIPPVLDDGPPSSWGIFVEAEASVTGNVIEGVPDEGIRLGWGPYLRNVSVTGNVIRRCGMGMAVSVVEGVGAVLITGNLVVDAERGAIVGHRWHEAVTGDLAADASAWAHLTITGNAVA